MYYLFYFFPLTLTDAASFVSTQNKSSVCRDNPTKCRFQTCDPAALIWHRIRFHKYIPKSSNHHNTGESSTAQSSPAYHVPVDPSSASGRSSYYSVGPSSTPYTFPFEYSYNYTSLLSDFNSLTTEPDIQCLFSQFTFDHSADQSYCNYN